MCNRPISRASGDWEGDEVKDHGQILYQAGQRREQGESFSLSVGSSRLRALTHHPFICTTLAS